MERFGRTIWVPLLACSAVLFLCAQLAANPPETTNTAARSAARPPGPQPKRARPPKWPADVVDAFFPDARTKLVGPRPDYGKTSAVAKNANVANSVANSIADSKPPATGDGGWSKLIDADTLETEIKRIAQQINKNVTAPAGFKGGGYKDCRRDFTVLAALFAVTAEYDGDARWKDASASLRDALARAGHNCKVGTDQSFQEAKQRKQDLADLVAGSRPKTTSDSDVKAVWPQVADRPPLMQRLGIAQQDRLAKWLANKQEFTTHRDDIKIESQLVATIAEIIGRDGYEFWDDATYAKLARELKQGGAELAAATETNNYDQARQALARTTKACADCHEGFRQ